MWAAYFQAMGEHRHTIAVRRQQHSTEYEAEKFVQRMTNPEVGTWAVWVDWIDDVKDDVRSTGGRDSRTPVDSRSAEHDNCHTAEFDSSDGE